MSRSSSAYEDRAVSRSSRGSLLAVFLLIADSCVFSSRTVLQPERDGREVFREACASCHGTTGTGNGPVAPALKNRPADLTRLAERNGGVFPRQYVYDVITGERTIMPHGEREMPVWSQRFEPSGSGATVGASIYTQMYLERLLGYLETIQRRAESSG